MAPRNSDIYYHLRTTRVRTIYEVVLLPSTHDKGTYYLRSGSTTIYARQGYVLFTKWFYYHLRTTRVRTIYEVVCVQKLLIPWAILPRKSKCKV